LAEQDPTGAEGDEAGHAQAADALPEPRDLPLSRLKKRQTSRKQASRSRA